jgi:inhibitor of KinA sporulation pathway (predicted exonuclease)
MTTTINEKKTVSLLDGTEIEVRPLKISLLRDFMKNFEKLAEVSEDNEASMDVLMECVRIALTQYKPELAADAKVLEDNLDLPTVYKIVEEASGNASLFNNFNK